MSRMLAREDRALHYSEQKVNKHDCELDDGTALIKSDDLPSLKVGDKIEISTDGKNVLWNFVFA